MRSTAPSQKTLVLRAFWSPKQLAAIDGLEVKRSETAQKLRRVSVSYRWVVTRSSGTHSVGIHTESLICKPLT